MNVRLKKYLAMILLFLCVITINPQNVHAADKNPQRETIRVGFFAMDGYHMIDDEEKFAFSRPIGSNECMMWRLTYGWMITEPSP